MARKHQRTASQARVAQSRLQESGVGRDQRRSATSKGTGKSKGERSSRTRDSDSVALVVGDSSSRSSQPAQSRRSRSSRSHSSSSNSSPARLSASAQGRSRTIDYGESQGFPDVRALDGEDLVAKTLSQTSGPLGVVSRPKVVDFNARLKERKQANRRRVMVRVFAVLGVLAAIAAMVWLLLFSPVFILEPQEVSIAGNNAWVSERQITAITSKQTGKSLFLVSTDDIAAQLDGIPGVTKAQVDKHYPKSLSVEVHAQEPAALLKTPDGKSTAVDGEARVLNSVVNTPVEGIPVIETGSVDEGLKNRAVQQALKILNQMPKQMRQRVSKVTAQTQDSVTTEIDNGGRVIVWGDASQIKLKLAVVDKIVNDPTKIGDKHQVDVSAPLRPIIK